MWRQSSSQFCVLLVKRLEALNEGKFRRTGVRGRDGLSGEFSHFWAVSDTFRGGGDDGGYLHQAGVLQKRDLGEQVGNNGRLCEGKVSMQ